MKKNILVVNENLKACDEIKGALQDEYSTEVYCASSIEEAIEVFVKHRFCLVILDVHLAGSDGLKLLGIMRQAKPVPILVLSGKDKPLKRTEALRAGTSAYLEEPFELEEITAQAQSLMELYINTNPLESRCYTLAFGLDLIIDPTYWKVTLKGEPLELTHREFMMLYCLASHKGQVLTKEQLYEWVWNEERNINVEATIKSHIRTLRKKMSPAGRELIENVRGVGYRFNGDTYSK